mgnify:CR=1 FL=1
MSFHVRFFRTKAEVAAAFYDSFATQWLQVSLFFRWCHYNSTHLLLSILEFDTESYGSSPIGAGLKIVCDCFTKCPWDRWRLSSGHLPNNASWPNVRLVVEPPFSATLPDNIVNNPSQWPYRDAFTCWNTKTGARVFYAPAQLLVGCLLQQP